MGYSPWGPKESDTCEHACTIMNVVKLWPFLIMIKRLLALVLELVPQKEILSAEET